MEKVLIWLDDYRNPFEGDWLNFSPIGKDVKVIWVKNYIDFILWIIKNGMPDGICFDHDLGEELTGYDCAKWVCDYCLNNNLKLPLYSVQSANPVGKLNIEMLMNNYKKYMDNL